MHFFILDLPNALKCFTRVPLVALSMKVLNVNLMAQFTHRSRLNSFFDGRRQKRASRLTSLTSPQTLDPTPTPPLTPHPPCARAYVPCNNITILFPEVGRFRALASFPANSKEYT
jgi:hypothetical protein